MSEYEFWILFGLLWVAAVAQYFINRATLAHTKALHQYINALHGRPDPYPDEPQATTPAPDINRRK